MSVQEIPRLVYEEVVSYQGNVPLHGYFFKHDCKIKFEIYEAKLANHVHIKYQIECFPHVLPQFTSNISIPECPIGRKKDEWLANNGIQHWKVYCLPNLNWIVNHLS
jgi:hypothetical protein